MRIKGSLYKLNVLLFSTIILREIVSQFTLIRKATKAAVTAPNGATFA
jgi:hypothetical protein